MTTLPAKNVEEAADAFASAAARIQRADRKTKWASSVLKSLLHALLAAVMVVWSIRGYLDKFDSRIQTEEDRRESIERRLDAIDQNVQHLGDRLDQVLLGRSGR